MTKDPADKWKPDPATRANAGERVPQVVNADIADAGRLADPTPLLGEPISAWTGGRSIGMSAYSNRCFLCGVYARGFAMS